MKIERITVMVKFDNGDEMIVNQRNPRPSGDNDRFMMQQLVYGVSDNTKELTKMILARWPDQIGLEGVRD